MSEQELPKDPTVLARMLRGERYKVKQLGKQLGRAGATIFALRNENAALREATSRPIGDHARLLAQLREAAARNHQLSQENSRLREVNQILREKLEGSSDEQ